MHGHAVKLRRMAEAVPIGLLHLPCFVGIEDAVAARGATGQGPDHARFNDASSGHAVSGSENRAHKGGRVSPQTSTRVYRWLPKVSAERIARAAYRSAMKGRTTVVLGVLNKILAFLGELRPRQLPLPCSRCCRGEGPDCRARCRRDTFDLRGRKALSQRLIAGL